MAYGKPVLFEYSVKFVEFVLVVIGFLFSFTISCCCGLSVMDINQ